MSIVKIGLDALKEKVSPEDVKAKKYTKEINNILTKAKEKDKNYNPHNYFIIFSPDVINNLLLEENVLLSFINDALFYEGINAIIQYNGENIFNLYKNITDDILNQKQQQSEE